MSGPFHLLNSYKLFIVLLFLKFCSFDSKMATNHICLSIVKLDPVEPDVSYSLTL